MLFKIRLFALWNWPLCYYISFKFLGQHCGETDTTSKDPQLNLLHFADSYKEIQYIVFIENTPNNALILILTKENKRSFFSLFFSLYVRVSVCVRLCLCVCMNVFKKNVCNYIEIVNA